MASFPISFSQDCVCEAVEEHKQRNEIRKPIYAFLAIDELGRHPDIDRASDLIKKVHKHLFGGGQLIPIFSAFTRTNCVHIQSTTKQQIISIECCRMCFNQRKHKFESPDTNSTRNNKLASHLLQLFSTSEHFLFTNTSHFKLQWLFM